MSAGFSYTYSTTQPCNSRITNISLNGVPIASTDEVRVAASAFLAAGASGRFPVFTEGANTTTDGTDLAALVSYFRTFGVLAPPPQNRIIRIA